MRRPTKITLILVPAVLVLAAGSAYLDHTLSHDDRIAATAAIDLGMVDVRDQVLRFENDVWRLPKSLDELVPEYVREDQLRSDGEDLYVYDPAARTITQREGCLIRGLVRRRRDPVAMTLPPVTPPIEERRRAAAKTVFDALQRYEHDHGVLPLTLDALAPLYVEREVLTRWDQPFFAYEPGKRRLAQVVVAPGPEGLAPIEMTLPLVDLALSNADDQRFAVARTPRGPDLPEAPKGALVFEAEHFSASNWGWEIHPDPSASGGAYLHSWEGITNGPAQVQHRVFDFWNLTPPEEYTRLTYHVHVPTAGSYYLYGLMWTTDTHCSNAIHAGIDRDPIESDSMGNRTPFRWLWSPSSREPHYFSAGDHDINLFIHEDGIKIDQLMLSPRQTYDGQAYRPNLSPGDGTAWAKKAGPPVHLSYDLKSQVISPTSAPECSVVLRRIRPATGEATLRVQLTGALPRDMALPIAEHRVDLAKLPEVSFVPLSFANVELASMSRREYLLVAELLVDGKPVAHHQVTLMRPWVWEACGPLRYYRNYSAGPLDGSAGIGKDSDLKWRPIEEKHMDHFGVLDFGLWCGAASLHAPQDKTVYARTRLMAPETARYLFLIQTDDQMTMWIDGREVYRYDDDNYMPVTRSARRRHIRLTAGEHELRIRVNQTHTRWQAAVRVRTDKDELSHVVGLPEPSAETAARD